MFFRKGNRGSCPGQEAGLENYLGHLRAGLTVAADADLTAHLAGCAGCREALAEARQASELLIAGRAPMPENILDDPFFASRVTARIHAFEAARVSGAEFWPALETLSLRLSGAALSAALILGAWAAWQGQAVRQKSVETARVRATSGATAGEVRRLEARGLFPEMKRPPDNAGEAMLILASSENGRQR